MSESFIDMGQELEDTQEPLVAPEGMADLVVRKATRKVYEDGTFKGVTFTIGVDRGDGEDYKPAYIWIGVPNPAKEKAIEEEKGMDPGTIARMKRLEAKRFLRLFKVKTDGKGRWNPDDAIGQTARAGLIIEDDSQFGRSNKVILPPLAEEEPNNSGGARRRA